MVTGPTPGKLAKMCASGCSATAAAMASSKSASWLLSSCSSRAKLLSREALAGDRARGSGEEVGAHPFGQHLRGHPAGVVVPGQEPAHSGGLDPPGDRRGGVVQHERERDLTVDRGEQPRRSGVVGLEDRSQLALHGLLGFQEPVPVAGKRLDLCQQRRGLTQP